MKLLPILGKIDGSIALGMAGWGLTDPEHAKLALLIGGIAGALGTILNLISHYIGGGAVVPEVPGG